MNQRIIHSRDWQNQKQPFKVVLKKNSSETMHQIYIRAPSPKCDLGMNFGMGVL